MRLTRIITLLLSVTVLASCATTSSRPLTEADLALRRINQERIRNAQQPSYESSTVSKPGPSASEVIGAIIALPIVIPIAAMVEYGRYPASVHCHSYTYKDAYHATCY